MTARLSVAGSLPLTMAFSLLLASGLSGCDGGDIPELKSTAHSGNSDYGFDAYGNPTGNGVVYGDGETASR